MRETLVHRGPDGDGEAEIASNGGPLHGWFGHRRLKILDLTEHAHQPMRGSDGKTHLTYNGEIYNFRDLRRELQAAGMAFHSTGDTEVVLRAYEHWGPACVTRFEGMFAFALWDARRQTLFLARDRTGKKPLFYAHNQGLLTFGSEIKAVLAAPWTRREPDTDAIPALLAHGYVPCPNTPYKGIRQVPPGSTLSFGPDGLKDSQRYWRPRPTRLHGRTLRTPDAEIREAFQQAVRRRLVADVPLGAFLSGGIDSSLVVGVASDIVDEPLRTFSIGFPQEPSFDERNYARQVASRFQTNHTEFAVDVDAVRLLDRLVWHLDGPFGDSSAVPTYIVSQLASEHVTVVLNGDGGDELFGGYDRFRAAALARLVPRMAAPALGALAGRMSAPGDSYHSRARQLVRFIEQSGKPLRDRYRGWVAVSDDATVARLMGGAAGSSPADLGEPARAALADVQDLPVLDQLLYLNFTTYLPDDLSVKVDRMSMAHSLEARSPFLDSALIDHAVSIPADRRVGVKRLKPVLRSAFSDLLPTEIWDRRKQGFGAPLGQWFRGSLAEVFGDEVLAFDSCVRDVIEMDALDDLWREHSTGFRNHGSTLWTILTLERWLRTLKRPLEECPPAVGVSAA